MTADWTFTGSWLSSSCNSALRTAATPSSTSPREGSTQQVGGGGAEDPGAEPLQSRELGRSLTEYPISGVLMLCWGRVKLQWTEAGLHRRHRLVDAGS